MWWPFILLLPDATGGVVKPLPNGTGYTVQNMTAKTMMATMYRIPARQIEGGPDWFGSDRFDVEARADRGSYSIDELHTMFKNLLKDRFGLEVSRRHQGGSRLHFDGRQGRHEDEGRWLEGGSKYSDDADRARQVDGHEGTNGVPVLVSGPDFARRYAPGD